MATKVIEISEGPDVGPRLSKKNGDQIEWSSQDKVYTVNFPFGSPFAESKFVVAAMGSVSSGAIQASADGAYKYTVTGQSGELDPKIFVDP